MSGLPREADREANCGFASRDAGNLITAEDQTAKLAQVVQVAADVWGGVLPSRG